jgi:iron complex outermembrane receptor protein
MSRSRVKKLKRARVAQDTRRWSRLPLASAISAILAGAPPAFAQEQEDTGTVTIGEVTVTAQKRMENLQDVPVSITAFGTEKLEQLHIEDFDDYVKYLPSVSYQPLGPGFAQVYMRGVASGGDGNHSGPLPSVGVYLDEQPITTIQGPLDVYLYDIERVEALFGPQGTLYGANSQAGTLRIITNKPDPRAFSASYDIEGNYLDGGDAGYLAAGYVNIPVSENAAIRLVGWGRQDAGYMDNVNVPRTFPTSGITVTNSNTEDDFNDVETYGARAALRVELNDSWSITPVVMGQEQKANGTFGFDRTIGELQVSHRFADKSKDRWGQAALTVQGALSNFELIYAGSYLKRDVDTQSDYSDYSYWYDTLYGYGEYMYNDAGDLIDPSQHIQGKDRYERQTHELRLASPSDNRFRFVVGAFYQRSEHKIEQRYLVDDLTSLFEIQGWEDTLWLTEQVRIDRDEAIFGEMSFDFTEKLTATAGVRFFDAENSLEGFFGFNENFSGSTGESACPGGAAGPDFPGVSRPASCQNLDKVTKEDDYTPKVNLTYKFTDDVMVYATYAEGFRPGGINRRGTLPPYLSDFLTSYELGWKTTLADGRVRLNGSVFHQEWDDFQFALLGANGLTEIKNANQAEIRGVEADIAWAVTNNLTLTAAGSWLDSELTENYCGFTDADGNPVTDCPVGSPQAPLGPEAPEGTELPVTPKFKGNLTARYGFPLGSFDAHLQGSVIYQGERWTDLRLIEREIIGKQPSYELVDFSAGIGNERFSLGLFVTNVLDERAELFKFAQCAETVCGTQTYVVTNQPRTYGLRFGQKF